MEIAGISNAPSYCARTRTLGENDSPPHPFTKLEYPLHFEDTTTKGMLWGYLWRAE